MRLLVLGGTAWLGSTIAAEALGRGHEVTCLARGRSAAPPVGATLVSADRETPDAYQVVAHQRWDAVVDVARQPGQVRRATAVLEPVAARYLFVSAPTYTPTSGPCTKTRTRRCSHRSSRA